MHIQLRNACMKYTPMHVVTCTAAMDTISRTSPNRESQQDLMTLTASVCLARRLVVPD